MRGIGSKLATQELELRDRESEIALTCVTSGSRLGRVADDTITHRDKLRDVANVSGMQPAAVRLDAGDQGIDPAPACQVPRRGRGGLHLTDVLDQNLTIVKL